MEMLEKALKMLERHPLCDHCLGRQFALLGYKMDNETRGHHIKTLLVMEGHRLAAAKDKRGVSILKTLVTNGSVDMATELLKKLHRRTRARRKCFLCGGRFESLPRLVATAVELLRDYDYKTFLVGVKLPLEVAEKEDEFKATYGVEHSESMRNDLSRTTGKMIAKTVEKDVDYMKPDIVVIVNPFAEEIELQVNPLFIMGRYKKLVRGIPQSKWLCMKCRGEGCPKCDGTGKMYPESVEELISSPIMEATAGEDVSFHAAGREDIDARMLGRGRPFIVEVKRPKKRFLDLFQLREKINEEAADKVRVSKLRFVDRDMVRKLKEMEGCEKLYRVTVEFDREVSDQELDNVERTFKDSAIQQQTPKRVLHRRADLTRERYIYETRVKRLAKNQAEIRIRCQGGLYIKELVTGDEGRTKPNISEVTKAKTTPLQLDVLNVYTKNRRFVRK